MTNKSEQIDLQYIESIDYKSLGIEELINVFVHVHHVYICEKLKTIEESITNAWQKYAANFPEFDLLVEFVKPLCIDLRNHIDAEESLLFPDILNKEKRGQLKQYEFEHEESLGAIKQLNLMTDSFTCPYSEKEIKLIYENLHDLCNVLYLHIHCEDQYLFPKVRF